jgi:hypothetical protein
MNFTFEGSECFIGGGIVMIPEELKKSITEDWRIKALKKLPPENAIESFILLVDELAEKFPAIPYTEIQFYVFWFAFGNSLKPI